MSRKKTLTKWKNEGEWDIMFKMHPTVTARKIIENLYKRSYELKLILKQTDDIIKLALSIEKLFLIKRVTISQIINVFKDFIAFIFKRIILKSLQEINLCKKKYVDFKIGEK